MRKPGVRLALGTCALALLGSGGTDHAAVTILGQFNSGVGTPVGCGFDRATDGVWVYGDFSATIARYSRSGVPLGTIARPGEPANDVDVTFAPESLMLGTTGVPAGTLLFINGETGAAEIYATDKFTGSVLATLPTAFGVSHVVGGAYHPDRDTFFLVQDRQPTGTANDNVVAEIDPVTGSILGAFATTTASSTFTVNFGDLDIGANGNMFVVSSDETTVLELTPSGALVQELALPAGVSSLSGIGLDNDRGEAWVSGTGGTIWRLGGFPVGVPFGSIVLTVAKGAAAIGVLSWAPVSNATAYDVVRGDLDQLRASAGDFASATAACLADNVGAAPVDDPLPLAIAERRFYLVRAIGGSLVGSYDSGHPSQQGSRDLEIAASGAPCP